MGKDYKDRIVVDTKIHFGKPCIAGTRITVENVLELIQNNISFDDIIRDYYEHITKDDILACIRYAKSLIEAEGICLE